MTRRSWSLVWISAMLCGALWLAGANDATAGMLRISSTPSGAQLYVNGTKRGRTPFASKVNPGRYHVELRRKGYLTWTSYIEVPQRASLRMKASLERNRGGAAAQGTAKQGGTTNTAPAAGQQGGLLIVNTTPSGASVYLNDNLLGKSPMLKFIPIGSHSVRVEHAGYQSYTKQIRVRTSKSVRVKVKLTAGSGGAAFRMRKRGKKPITDTPTTASGSNTGGGTTLMITSRPKAKVYLDGRYLGRTPVLSAGIKVGSHQLMLKRRGYIVYRRTIQLSGGAMTRIKASLVRRR